MINFKTATASLIAAFTLIIILAIPASAGLLVTNAKIQESVSPGQTNTYVMKVTANSSEAMDITVEVRGLGNYITGPIDPLTPENDLSPYTARTFITATPTSFHLEPWQSQDVTVTVNVPTEVGDGGRYAAIFIYTAPSGDGPIGVSAAVGAQVMLTIEGSNIILAGDITSIDIPEAVSEQLFEATVTLQNTGNYHYKLDCSGTVWNEDRSQMVGVSWPTDSIYNFIPTFTREIVVPLNISQELTPGTYFLDIEAYTEDGILLDTGTKSFVITDTYKPMKLNPLLIEFFNSGQLSVNQWSMAEDGTLMEYVDASSLTSAVRIYAIQGTKVTGADGGPPSPITVEALAPPPAPPPDNVVVMAHEFSSEGINFDPKADITFEYSPFDIPDGVSEEQLRIATINEDTWLWEFIEGAEIDPNANTITFPVTHFSVYAIIAPLSGEAGSSGAGNNIWVWMVIGAICVTLLAFSIDTLRRRRAVAIRKEQARRRRRAARPSDPNDDW
jgi:heme exporter protein D